MSSTHLPKLVERCLQSLEGSERGVVVAVSGGPDSVALARAVVDSSAGKPIVLAHLNHQLRAVTSDEDEAFVVELHTCLAANLPNLRCIHQRRDVGGEARALGVNLEGHARQVRYQWLTDTALAFGACWILTGHTANDQAETVLHRLLRGTGLQGLRGIGARRDLGRGVSVARPLLPLTRAEVLAYLEDLGQPYRHDPSNDNLDLTRNRIRHELLPQLAARYNPAIVSILTRLAEQADEAFRDDEAAAALLLRECERPRAGETIVLDCTPLLNASRRLVREVFRLIWRREGWPTGAMDYNAWGRLAALVFSETTAIDLPGNVRALRRERVVQITHG
jgi:tRNA(Ile)-lysidine synthase